MASTLGLVGLANRTPYATSKGAVVPMTRALVFEFALDKTTANAICPGPFLTPMNIPIAESKEAKKIIVGATAVQRWGERRPRIWSGNGALEGEEYEYIGLSRSEKKVLLRRAFLSGSGATNLWFGIPDKSLLGFEVHRVRVSTAEEALDSRWELDAATANA